MLTFVSDAENNQITWTSLTNNFCQKPVSVPFLWTRINTRMCVQELLNLLLLLCLLIIRILSKLQCEQQNNSLSLKKLEAFIGFLENNTFFSIDPIKLWNTNILLNSSKIKLIYSERQNGNQNKRRHHTKYYKRLAPYFANYVYKH